MASMDERQEEPRIPEPKVGDVLGNYKLTRPLGSGGMGKVYKAVHTASGMTVAVRVLPAFLSEQEFNYVKRFIDDSKAVAKLRHPNIVQEFQVGAHEGRYYVVMEFVTGESLGARLAREGTLQESHALRIIRDVARALEAAHRLGIIHRHIKPSNVLLAQQDFVRVSDFCCSRIDRRLGRFTESGEILELAYYTAPESVAAPAVDIYGLGATLYRAVTGRPPFQGETPLSIRYKHASEVPVSPAAFAPSLSQETIEIIARALRKDSRKRFASAGQMARAAEEAINSIRNGKARAAEGRGSLPGLNAFLEITHGKRARTKIPVSTIRRYMACVREKGTPRAYCAISNDGKKLRLSCSKEAVVLVNDALASTALLQHGDRVRLHNVELRCGILPRAADSLDFLQLALNQKLMTEDQFDSVLRELTRREADGELITAGHLLQQKGFLTRDQVARLRGTFDELIRVGAAGGKEAKPTLTFLEPRTGVPTTVKAEQLVVRVGSLTLGEEAAVAARTPAKVAAKTGKTAEEILEGMAFCDRCDETIPPQDIVKGRATQVSGKYYCWRCSSADPLVGTIILARQLGVSFRIEAPLGQGALGRVYRATQLATETLVALKVIPEPHGRNALVAKRMCAFLDGAVKLKHPGLVEVYPAHETQECLLVPAEYAGDRSLADVCPRTPSPPDSKHRVAELQDAAEMVRHAAVALEYAQRKRVVHRELRPEKIFISLDGKVKVADLGLPTSIILGGSKSGPRQAHRERFAAPEILENAGRVDVRADIYSLGLILCALVAGTRFLVSHMIRGGLSEELQGAILRSPPFPLDVPLRLSRFIRRMISPLPRHRPAHMSQVAREMSWARAYFSRS